MVLGGGVGAALGRACKAVLVRRGCGPSGMSVNVATHYDKGVVGGMCAHQCCALRAQCTGMLVLWRGNGGRERHCGAVALQRAQRLPHCGTHLRHVSRRCTLQIACRLQVRAWAGFMFHRPTTARPLRNSSHLP